MILPVLFEDRWSAAAKARLLAGFKALLKRNISVTPALRLWYDHSSILVSVDEA